MSILISCRRCGTDIESENAHLGFCGKCYAQDLINPYRPEITRLALKRSRYLTSGISVANLNHQLGSLCNRAERKARDTSPRLAINEIRIAIAEALQGESRIAKA